MYRKYPIEDIYIEFFEEENQDLDFLKNLNTYEEIENKIELTVSKILMHDHEDVFDNLVNEYLIK